MQIEDIKKEIVKLVKDSLNVTVLAMDVEKPIVKPSAKVDILPYYVSSGCSGARETSLDIDIYYYAQDSENYLNECYSVAQKLALEFTNGFLAKDIFLIPDDDISFDFNNNAMACQFTVSYHESLQEDGEFMENLIFNGEEFLNGDNNATD